MAQRSAGGETVAVELGGGAARGGDGARLTVFLIEVGVPYVCEVVVDCRQHAS